jgi:hypothetical protein
MCNFNEAVCNTPEYKLYKICKLILHYNARIPHHADNSSITSLSPIVAIFYSSSFCNTFCHFCYEIIKRKQYSSGMEVQVVWYECAFYRNMLSPTSNYKVKAVCSSQNSEFYASLHCVLYTKTATSILFISQRQNISQFSKGHLKN